MTRARPEHNLSTTRARPEHYQSTSSARPAHDQCTTRVRPKHDQSTTRARLEACLEHITTNPIHWGSFRRGPRPKRLRPEDIPNISNHWAQSAKAAPSKAKCIFLLEKQRPSLSREPIKEDTFVDAWRHRRCDDVRGRAAYGTRDRATPVSHGHLRCFFSAPLT